jgi:uncharacterized membrane protein YeaQ/YmgE (transglycosylase-associated protein family)
MDHLLGSILHHLLTPFNEYCVLGFIGGFLTGRLMRVKGFGAALDPMLGIVGAYVARRLASHFLGLESEGSHLYIVCVGLGGGFIFSLLLRLFIGLWRP